jgi:hypothetical protein
MALIRGLLTSEDNLMDETNFITTLHITYKERKGLQIMNFTKNIGMLLLAIWLILYGLATFIPALSGLGVILAILAIAAGVFILLGR